MRVEGLVGTRFADKFLVESLVFEGGQTAVFKGFDELLKRWVAIKVLTPTEEHAELNVAIEVERLYREAIALAKVAHPNIPTVYEAGHDAASGLNYVVLQWLAGAPLAAFVKHPLSERQLMRVALDVSAACAAAHRRGILHRDLRPSNVLAEIDDDGRLHAKLLDFGVAQFDSSYELTRLTAPDEVMGDLSYISPEQAQGAPVDTRTDVYALGALVFELACGFPPFGETPMKVIAAHIQGDRAKLKCKPGLDLSPLFKALVKRCLERDADARFADCGQVHEALHGLVRELPATNPRAIESIAVDPQARHLVVGRADGSIEVFDQRTGARQLAFDGHRGAVVDLIFRPDTEEFLSAGDDGHIHLWSISEGCRAGSWPGLRGRHTHLAFSPFGYIFASGEPDGRIRLWSLLEQRPLGVLEGHEGPVSVMHFIPGGRYLASGSRDGALMLWDIGEMCLAESCSWRRGAVTHLAMHVRDRFVVAFEDGTMAMGRWSVPEPLWHRRVHDGPIHALFEQSGGQGVISTGRDGAIHCSDVFDGEERREPVRHVEGIRAAAFHARSELTFVATDSVIMRWAWHHGDAATLEGYLVDSGRGGWLS